MGGALTMLVKLIISAVFLAAWFGLVFFPLIAPILERKYQQRG